MNIWAAHIDMLRGIEKQFAVIIILLYIAIMVRIWELVTFLLYYALVLEIIWMELLSIVSMDCLFNLRNINYWTPHVFMKYKQFLISVSTGDCMRRFFNNTSVVDNSGYNVISLISRFVCKRCQTVDVPLRYIQLFWGLMVGLSFIAWPQ